MEARRRDRLGISNSRIPVVGVINPFFNNDLLGRRVTPGIFQFGITGVAERQERKRREKLMVQEILEEVVKAAVEESEHGRENLIRRLFTNRDSGPTRKEVVGALRGNIVPKTCNEEMSAEHLEDSEMSGQGTEEEEEDGLEGERKEVETPEEIHDSEETVSHTLTRVPREYGRGQHQVSGVPSNMLDSPTELSVQKGVTSQGERNPSLRT